MGKTRNFKSTYTQVRSIVGYSRVWSTFSPSVFSDIGCRQGETEGTEEEEKEAVAAYENYFLSERG